MWPVAIVHYPTEAFDLQLLMSACCLAPFGWRLCGFHIILGTGLVLKNQSYPFAGRVYKYICCTCAQYLAPSCVFFAALSKHTVVFCAFWHICYKESVGPVSNLHRPGNSLKFPLHKVVRYMPAEAPVISPCQIETLTTLGSATLELVWIIQKIPSTYQNDLRDRRKGQSQRTWPGQSREALSC